MGLSPLKPEESAFYPCSNKAVCADESVQRRFVSLLDKTAGHYDDLLSRTLNPDMPSSTGTGKQLFSEGEQITLSCAISVDGEEMSFSCKKTGDTNKRWPCLPSFPFLVQESTTKNLYSQTFFQSRHFS